MPFGKSNFMINSFTFVATNKTAREAALTTFSINRLYPKTKIYAYTDEKVASYLKNFYFPNLEIIPTCTPEKLKSLEEITRKIFKKNSFHNKEAIAFKMEALKNSVLASGNTFFLDADIVLVKPIDENLDTNLDGYIAPHYHAANIIHNNKTYGCFNAGYLYTKNPDFAEEWLDIYLNRSSYYEQQGMIYLFEAFHLGLFDKTHNFGLWRLPRIYPQGQLRFITDDVNFKNFKSFHYHAFPETYSHAENGLKAGFEKLAEIVTANLPQDLKDFIKNLDSIPCK